MSVTIANAAAFLKELYPTEKILDTVYKNNPFLALVPKDENMEGELRVVPVHYGLPNGRSATFATAVANKGQTPRIAFNVTRKSDYSLGSISNEAYKASRSSLGAITKLFTDEQERVLRAATRSAATSVFRSGSGSLGRISSGEGTPTVTLTEVKDANNFEVGMVVVTSTADGGGAVKAGTVTITGINRTLGTLTAAANWSAGIGTIAANDYIFVEGDYDLKLSGLADWIPTTAPTAGDNQYGVDRSVDVDRLAGIRTTQGALSISEAMIDLAGKVGELGGAPDTCFVSFTKYIELVNELGAKVQYNQRETTGKVMIGFKGVDIDGPTGPVTVIADHNCPKNLCYMLTMNTWELGSLDAVPHVIDTDGMIIRAEASADAFEWRMGYYGNLYCKAPGHNGVLTFA